MSNKKSIFIIFGIVIFIVSGLVVSVMQRKQPIDATTDAIKFSNNREVIDSSNYTRQGWIPYTSESGYLVMYKPGWITRRAPDSSALSEEYYIYPKEIEFGPAPLLSVRVEDGTLESFLEEIRAGRRSNNELTHVDFNGYAGFKQKIDASELFVVEKNGKLAFLVYSPNDLYQISEEEGLATLASFNFIK